MSLDCDTEIIKLTINNLRDELRNEKVLSKKKDEYIEELKKSVGKNDNNMIYEKRIKDLMIGWRSEREELLGKIKKLENEYSESQLEKVKLESMLCIERKLDN